MVMRQRQKEHKQACSRPALRAPLVSRARAELAKKKAKKIFCSPELRGMEEFGVG